MLKQLRETPDIEGPSGQDTALIPDGDDHLPFTVPNEDRAGDYLLILATLVSISPTSCHI